MTIHPVLEQVVRPVLLRPGTVAGHHVVRQVLRIAPVHLREHFRPRAHCRNTSEEIGVRLPNIMISAFPNPSVELRARANGAIGYLEKPVDDARLMRLLGEVVPVGGGDEA